MNAGEICARFVRVPARLRISGTITSNLEREKRKGTMTDDLPEDTISFFHIVINSTLVGVSLDA